MKIRHCVAVSVGAWCLLAWNGPRAQGQSEFPEPAPTNAVQTLQKALIVEGVGSVPLGGDPEASEQQAYQAAVLDAYQQLFWQGAEHVALVPPDLPLLSRSFRLDEQHPNLALLDWMLRSEILQKQVIGSRVQVTVESPPLADLNQENRHVVRQMTQDVDGDGKPEIIAVQYDGRIQVLKSTLTGYKVLASSPTLNVFQCSTMRQSQGEPWNQVQLTRVTNVSNLERVGVGKIRVLADLTLGEVVDRHWIGKASEQREVFLRWDQEQPEPAIEVTEPADFLYTKLAQVPWKGVLKTPAGLQSAKLRVNGRPFWQTPDQMSSQRLRMDILLPLLPGVNRAQVVLTDQVKRSLSREVLLYRDARCPAPNPKLRRALLVGVDEYSATQFPKLPGVVGDLGRLQKFLLRADGGAFAADQVVVLQGKQATRAQILSALQKLTRVEGDDRVMIMVYFAGLSSGSVSGTSKGLLPYDAKGFDQGSIGARDLLAAVGELRQQDMLLAVDTSYSRLQASDPDQLWLDSQEFSERLAQQGWAVLCSVDSSHDVRDGVDGSRLLSAFLESLTAKADANGDGLIEWDESYRSLFQGIRLSSPGTAPPLRRGEVLGRVPLATAKF